MARWLVEELFPVVGQPVVASCRLAGAFQVVEDDLVPFEASYLISWLKLFWFWG